MKRFLVVATGILTIALMLALPAGAQGSYPLNDTFDTTVSGWTPTMHIENGQHVAYASITWLATKDLFTEFPGVLTTANGVIEVDHGSSFWGWMWPDIQKSVYLQPGHYQVKLRAGADMQMTVKVQLMSGVTNPTIMAGYLSNEFVEKTSDVFTIVQPGPITIVISGDQQFFIDRVQVVPYTGPTPTPYTTLEVTPIPTQYQATPMPVPTQYCQMAAATPTGPANWDVTPTATPDTTGDYQFVDTFSSETLSTDWLMTGGGAVPNPNISGPDAVAGVLEMRYSQPENISGLVWYHDITPTVYFDGWAMANALPQGITATVNVSLWDGTNHEWVEAGSAEFGPGQWYPFHITVSDPGGHPLPYNSIRFWLSGPAGDRGYLDNIYIYNSLRGVPICLGAYEPPGPNYDTTVLFPADKPCPVLNSTLFDVPNNFWGPLFHWMSVQFIKITARWPFHTFQGYALAIRAFADAPFWKYVAAVGMMFDLRPIILMAGTLTMLEIVRLLYSLWRLLLKIIPFLG